VGSIGTDARYFYGPIYLTVGPDGLLYVADEGNHRVQVFRLLPPLALAAGTPPGADAPFPLRIMGTYPQPTP
jgi:hypothetical protein